MSSIGLNVQQEIDSEIEKSETPVAREKVVEMVQFLLDECDDDPYRKHKYFCQQVLAEYYDLTVDNPEVLVSSQVVVNILNRSGTVQP